MYISIYHNKLNVSNAHMTVETALYIDGVSVYKWTQFCRVCFAFVLSAWNLLSRSFCAIRL